jgi:hypothetical protein
MNFVALESIFEALETIFEVGFEFFSVFRLDLAGNEESPRRWFGQKWWVTGEVREKKKKKKEKKKKKKKKNQACVR